MVRLVLLLALVVVGIVYALKRMIDAYYGR